MQQNITVPLSVNDPTSLVRMDRHMASNYSIIEELIGDGPLLRCIVYYLEETFQNNIFGQDYFDVEEFAREYNFNLDNLKKRHPAPFQYQNMTSQHVAEIEARRLACAKEGKKIDEQLFVSVIENALYTLQNKPYYFSKFENGEKGGESMLVLKTLAQVTVKRKVYYRYTLSPDFEEHLVSCYTKGDIGVIKELRKKNLDQLYIFLCNLCDKICYNGYMITKENDTDFDVLCKIANVKKFKKNGEPIEMRICKRDLTDCVSFVAKVCNDIMPFDFRWIKGQGASFAYVPQFDFTRTVKEKGKHCNDGTSSFTPYSKKVETYEKTTEILLRCLNDAFRTRTKWGFDGCDYSRPFSQWFYEPHSEPDIDLAYRNATAIIFGENENYRKTDENIRLFLKHIENHRMEPIRDVIYSFVSTTYYMN